MQMQWNIVMVILAFYLIPTKITLKMLLNYQNVFSLTFDLFMQNGVTCEMSNFKMSSHH